MGKTASVIADEIFLVRNRRVRMFAFLVPILVIAGLYWPPPAATAEAKPSPRFKVVQGKGWSVCESYAWFLNDQPANEPLPACHLKLSPDLKDPDWEELDIRTQLEVVYSMEHPPTIVAINPDKPPPPFDQWKSDLERQIQAGRSPRLRRTHLALVEGGPVETVLAYEADRNECDETVQRMGYSVLGSGARLWLWDKRQSKIDDYHSGMAFPTAPVRFLLFHGKPLMFLTWWGNMSVTPQSSYEGRIGVFHIFPVPGSSDPYGNKERCQIGFDLPPAIVERMTK